MQVPLLSQSGITEKLGFSTTKTIWGAGCLLTSFTMAVNYLQGSRFSVSQMNGILKQANAFAGGSFLPEKAFGRFSYAPKITHAIAGDIRAELEDGRPVIIGVDIHEGSSSGYSGADHFILAVRANVDGSIVCNDPAGGKEVVLDGVTLKNSEKNYHGVETRMFCPMK